MAPVTNARVLFAAVPKDFPIPGETTVHDTTQTIDLDNVPLNGGFLIKTLVLSIDPYMRGRMRSPEQKSYSPPYTIGAPILGYGVSLVLRSENPDVAAGKYVYGTVPHQEYNIMPDMQGLTLLEKHPKLPWTVFVGAAGMPGAYNGSFSASGVNELCFQERPRTLAGKNSRTQKRRSSDWHLYFRQLTWFFQGETAFITTGAGPVGSMVIQLAKRDGLKVIASAGSDEKVKFMKEIGADVAFNYKTTSTREVLEREGPVDIYWDNVGGEILEAALDNANLYGRFLECGMISGYNTGQKGIKNLNQMFAKSLTMYGILVFRLQPKYDKEFYEVIPSALASGELKYSEDVSRGLETVGDVILRVQEGRNTGKAVVIVAEE
ncbi:NADP-dependent oxidoreductase RED1 [Mycena venus]|uniref:NADP-dependent oxidoreductase RED1 n=1 Tax=Mycena venus TaxID=2733690 RepID=A0A8H7DBP4_9AGAR|nr:NADP-dependent oxidoreductase RED1 [Mycena venus]